jgi:hypothetical protein
MKRTFIAQENYNKRLRRKARIIAKGKKMLILTSVPRHYLGNGGLSI